MKIEGWRIKCIDVSGLLGKSDIHWDLKPDINILGGANGSGKSTLLHALDIPFHMDSKEYNGIHCHAYFESFVLELYSGIKYHVKRLATTSQKELDLSINNGMEQKVVKTHQDISLSVETLSPNKNKGDFVKPSHCIYINTSDIAYRTINNLLEFSQQVKRPGSTMLDLLIEHALNERNKLFSQMVYNAMNKEDNKELSRLQNLFGRFDKVVSEFMPTYQLLNPSSLQFSIADEDNNGILYHDLSTGEKQVLYILLKVTNTLGEPTLLFLDEPDLGMHIDWKKILLKRLLKINPNMQIIAATHSPSLIDNMFDNVREISQLAINKKGDGQHVN